MMILQKTRGMSSVFEVRDALIPDNYEALMLAYNSMNYLPSSSFCEVDGNKRMNIKIDGLNTLSGKYSKCIPKMEDVKKLVNDLRSCILELKEYLLNPTNLVIDIRYILFDGQSDRYKFLYIPGCYNNFRDQMKVLFEEIMRMYDHQDRQGVVYLYDLYSRFLGENFTPEVFCRLIGNVSLLRNDQIENHKYYRPAAYHDNAQKYYPSSNSIITNNPPESQIIDEEKSGIRKADIGLYALVMAAVVVTAFVLIIIFGTGSLKFSVLMAVGAVIYIVVDVMQKRGAEEQHEIDESMNMYVDSARSFECSRASESSAGSYAGTSVGSYAGTPVGSYAGTSVGSSVELPVESPVHAYAEEGTINNSSTGACFYGRNDNTNSFCEENIDTSILSLGNETGNETGNEAENVSKLVPREGDRIEGSQIEEIYLIEGETKVGRQKSLCDFCLNDTSVSRVHAIFEKKGGSVFVRDAGSTNGTYLNEKRLSANEEVEVSLGDLVGIAEIIFECC